MSKRCIGNCFVEFGRSFRSVWATGLNTRFRSRQESSISYWRIRRPNLNGYGGLIPFGLQRHGPQETRSSLVRVFPGLLGSN